MKTKIFSAIIIFLSLAVSVCAGTVILEWDAYNDVADGQI